MLNYGYKRSGIAYYKRCAKAERFWDARQICLDDDAEMLFLKSEFDFEAATSSGFGTIWIGKFHWK